VAGRVAVVAIEATTGWRWVWRELVANGFEVRLAEPVQTRALLGRRRSAKSDRLDARWLARLLAKEMLPQSWIPPAAVHAHRTTAPDLELYRATRARRDTRIFVEGGQHEDAGLRGSPLGEVLGGGDPVELGHADVHQNDVGFELRWLLGACSASWRMRKQEESPFAGLL
jgi:transposase